MNLVSVNAGLPQEVIWHGRAVQTSIWKKPVQGRVHVATLNIDGDRQSDLSVHGGVDKAVYVYPSEHYPFWQGELPGADLASGSFGENFTTEGLLEDQVQVGDRLRLGTAEFIVTQPRMPCFKLGIRFGRADIIKRFLVSERTGFYLSVLKEGEIGAGDEIELLERNPANVKVVEVTRLYSSDKDNVDVLRRLIALEELPQSWREYLRKRLEKLGV